MHWPIDCSMNIFCSLLRNDIIGVVFREFFLGEIQANAMFHLVTEICERYIDLTRGAVSL